MNVKLYEPTNEPSTALVKAEPLRVKAVVVPRVEEKVNVAAKKPVVKSEKDDKQRIKKERKEFFETVRDYIWVQSTLRGSDEYLKLLERSIGSIVKLQYEGNVIVCFNTEWHQIVDTRKVEIKSKLGVFMLQYKGYNKFCEYLSYMYPYDSKRLYLLGYHAKMASQFSTLFPTDVDLGEYYPRSIPNPDFQYFKSSQLLPAYKWEI